MKHCVVVGGGAAGFMAAATLASHANNWKITILEQGKDVLQKVKISGGGRCNVTHQCFEVPFLIKNYPRGSKELQEVFYRFQPQDTIDFFNKNGVATKVEPDGRMFPISNSSQSIIDCFLKIASQHNIKINTQSKVTKLNYVDNKWKIICNNNTIEADHIILCTGSSASFWAILQTLGHTVVAPVPSLFTFQIKHPLILDLAGSSFQNSIINLQNDKLKIHGPCLITHWGLSGPAVLKLSAHRARQLFELNYTTQICINFTGLSKETMFEMLVTTKKNNPNKKIENTPHFELSHRFWKQLLLYQLIDPALSLASVKNEVLQQLANTLSACVMHINGKGIFKEEFVTAGGVNLKEINFKTMQSKIIPALSLAGEVLNIDGVTGGFNFQAAWSCGYIAGISLV